MAPSACGFFAQATPAAATTVSVGTTAVGARWVGLSSATGVAQGQRLALNNGVFEQDFTILTLQTTPTIVAYLNQAVQAPYAGGSNVTTYAMTSVPQNITIQGLTMTGACERFIEILRGINCKLVDCTFTDAGGSFPTTDYPTSFDVGCQACGYVNCTFVGPMAGAIENANACFIYGSTFTQHGASGSDQGWTVNDSFGTTIENTRAFGAGGAGLLVATATTGQCINTRIVGGQYQGNGSAGIYLSNSDQAVLVNVDCRGNTSGGISVGAAYNSRIVGCDVECNVTGIAVINNCKGTVIQSCKIGGCTNYGVLTNSDCETIGCTAQNGGGQDAAHGIIGAVNGGSYEPVVNVVGCDLVQDVAPGSGNGPACVYIADARATVADSHFVLDATNAQGVIQGGTAACRFRDLVVEEGSGASGTCFAFDFGGGSGFQEIDGTRVSGSHTTAMYAASTANVRLGKGNDFTGAATVFSIQTGAVVTMTQDQGVYADASTTGTIALGQVAAQSNVIKPTGALTANITYTVPAGIQGLRYIFANATSGAGNASIGVEGGASIAVAQVEFL